MTPAVAGLYKRKRLSVDPSDPLAKFKPLVRLKIDGHNRRARERWGRGAVDGHWTGDRRQRRRPISDRAGDIEVDDVGAGLPVGRDDRLAERACSGVMEIRHRERGEELAAFENLESCALLSSKMIDVSCA